MRSAGFNLRQGSAAVSHASSLCIETKWKLRKKLSLSKESCSSVHSPASDALVIDLEAALPGPAADALGPLVNGHQRTFSWHRWCRRVAWLDAHRRFYVLVLDADARHDQQKNKQMFQVDRKKRQSNSNRRRNGPNCHERGNGPRGRRRGLDWRPRQRRRHGCAAAASRGAAAPTRRPSWHAVVFNTHKRSARLLGKRIDGTVRRRSCTIFKEGRNIDYLVKSI